MSSKKLLAAILALSVVVGVGSIAFASQLSDETDCKEKFGNLTSTLLDGGYSADYADGMILFSNPEDNGALWLKNTASGTKRKIGNENASFINVIERDIYYISSDGKHSRIVKTNLNSGREVLLQSETELSNLFVSEENAYYLCGDSVVQYKISDGSETVIFSNAEMRSFVPKENGVYWLKEKPVQSQSHVSHSLKAYEGTEEEILNFNCYSYSSDDGTNTPANFAEVISADSADDTNGVGSLALSVEIGGVRIPTEEFPVGSYFTDSGLRCTDHGTGSCGWENEEACNCKAFHNGVSLKAIQCYGYARYIYYTCFGELGFSDSATSTNLGSLGRGEVTQESFKALIQQARPGAHLRVQYITANGYSISTHSMIILDSNENGFSVCEANADNKCGVSVRQIDYSTFVPTVVSVSFLMMPDSYPGYEEITTQPNGTPSDASTTSPDYQMTTDSVAVTTESASSEAILDSDEVSMILDVLSILIRIFVDCFNAIVRIVSSII